MNIQTLKLDFLTLSAPSHWSARCEREQRERIISFQWGDHTAGSLVVIAHRMPRHDSYIKSKPAKELTACVESYVGRIGWRLKGAAGEMVTIARDGGPIVSADFRLYDNDAEIAALLRAWRIPFRRHLAYAFYISEDWHESRLVREKELVECELVMESIAFAPGPSASQQRSMKKSRKDERFAAVNIVANPPITAYMSEEDFTEELYMTAPGGVSVYVTPADCKENRPLIKSMIEVQIRYRRRLEPSEFDIDDVLE